VLEFLQAREPDMVRRPFFAKYNPKATWYDDLEPFGKADEPYFIRAEDEPETVGVTVSAGGALPGKTNRPEIRSN
jgi:hypothetical protein